jgi:hypothetical protein
VHRKVAKRTDPLYIAPPPPQNIAVPLSTRRRSRRQIQLPPIQTSAAQLDDSADLSGPVSPPPPATVKALTRRRSSRRVIPTRSTGTPIPAASAAAATIRRRSSRRVIPPTSTATVDVSIAHRSRRQTKLPSIQTREEQLDDDDGDDDDDDDANDGDGDLVGPSWEDRFSELANFHRIHGHCNVASRDYKNKKLGYWVSNQRRTFRLHREGMTSPMTTFRIQTLESLGFEWDRLGATWEDRLSKLADYRKIHGYCNVPRYYSKNTKLAMWVKKHRGAITGCMWKERNRL